MLKGFFPVATLCLWALSGTGESGSLIPMEVEDFSASSAPPTMEISAHSDSCSKSALTKPPCAEKTPKSCDITPPEKCDPCKKGTPAPCPPKPCPKPRCKPPTPCFWRFNPCNPKGTSDRNINAFYFAADFLYWRAENHGYSYAYQIDALSPQSGKVLRFNPEWSPGFRAGIGWNLSYDFWDLFLNYTWVRNHFSNSRTNGLGFIPLWPVSNASSGLFQTAFGGVHVKLDMIDLEFGRLIYLTPSVAIRPHIGGKGGTLHQKFNTTFEDTLSGSNAGRMFNGKNNYWGGGPRIGFSGEWHLKYGFCFLGKLAGALLYGNTHVSTVAKQLPIGQVFYAPFREYRDDFYQLVPNLQLSFGPQWQATAWCEKVFVKLSASWEANYWWNQFNLPVGMDGFVAPLPTVGNQPLTLEGLTANFELDF